MSRPRDWTPLRPADPVGGDPAAIARLARRYAATAEAITTAATALRDIHDSATVWESEAGRAFRDRTTEVGNSIERAHARYAATADALADYARSLDGIQAAADLVLARAKRADEARDAAWRAREHNAALPEPDPAAAGRAQRESAAATGDLHAADEDLRELEAQWRSAGTVAADAIREITSGDPLEDGTWDDVLDVVSVLTDLAAKLSAAFCVLALALSIIPGLQAFAAVSAALSLITGAVSLAGNVVLAWNGRATLQDVLWDVVGVLSFGAGRAFALAGRAMTTGTRGLARPSYVQHLRNSGLTGQQAGDVVRRQGVPAGGSAASALASRARSSTGWLPTRGEWADAYRPSTLFRDPVPGRAPVVHASTHAAPAVAAGLRGAALADGATAVATTAGVAAADRTLRNSVDERKPPVPVGANR